MNNRAGIVKISAKGEIMKYEIEVVKVSEGRQGAARVKIVDVGERRFICDLEIFNNYFKPVNPPKSNTKDRPDNSQQTHGKIKKRTSPC